MPKSPPPTFLADERIAMRIHSTFLRAIAASIAALMIAFTAGTVLAEDEPAANSPNELHWHDTYVAGYLEAQKEQRDLFIFFHEPEKPTKWLKFQAIVEGSPEIQESLSKLTLAKVSLEEANEIDDSSKRIIDNSTFSELRGSEGIAMIDLSHKDEPFYAHVVSLFPLVANPFVSGGMISKDHLSELLKLPAGTLTQRTMVFAVRVHPESPVSADSQFCSILAAEAESHSQYQADIVDQGHHNWSSRFHSINAKMPGGLSAQEVVAESWPNENLMTAAKECVYSWRRSPGHWSAVRSSNDRFSYDMKRGRNGIWYATGLFARRN